MNEKNRRKAELIALIAFILLAAGEIVWGTVIAEGTDKLGAGLIVCGISVPAFSFIACAGLGIYKSRFKWLAALICTAYAYLLPLLIYSQSSLTDLFIGLIPSVLGVVFGSLINDSINKK